MAYQRLKKIKFKLVAATIQVYVSIFKKQCAYVSVCEALNIWHNYAVL